VIGRIFSEILRRLREALIEGETARRDIAAFKRRFLEKSLTSIAENVGLRGRPVPTPATRPEGVEDDLQLVTEVLRDAAKEQGEAADRLAQTQEGRKASPPFLRVGTREVVKRVSVAPASRISAATTAAQPSTLQTLWPVLRVLGLIAGIGFIVVKALQGLGNAAEKAGLKLRGILDQFADVSPAIAGMRAIMEMYQRRDRMAVARALAPQLQRELVSYKELLENTRAIRIAFAEVASVFRTFMNHILAAIGKVVDAIRKAFKFGSEEEEKKPAAELWPLLDALRRMAGGPALPGWTPVPPPKPFRGPRAQ